MHLHVLAGDLLREYLALLVMPMTDKVKCGSRLSG
ncbi:hypothetical protein XF_0346 [Xylella fastidiosa 9a5c]|uniref:Uncharacterized protein n=1 Tax=Xylella fastidiosa (strain 9a5c) TaxID=160492 RepID=Q9PGF6_XYLFA|nr:hypothetical protein XF_0346 [Xylella fastidiosa 9a5c]